MSTGQGTEHEDHGAFETDRFEVKSLLGRGAMGAVYRVLDKKLGKEVALKTLPEPTPEQLRDLKREFRVAADLTSPHLIELYELFAEGERCFFTMELLDGQDFIGHVRSTGSGAPTPVLERLIALLPHLVDGLGAIHAIDLLHRDIKPQNAMVTAEGRLVLLDFGLAISKRRDPLSEEPSLAGTMAYMAPEQAWGSSSKASDWYAVGAMLYEALTGAVPFAGEPARMLRARQRSAPPPPSRTKGIEVPAWLDHLVIRLLDPEPDRRPSASEIREALEGAALFRMAPGAPEDVPFVGREREIAAFREYFMYTDPPALRSAHVSGPSGMGKTTLIESFIQKLQEDERVLLLRSRCHPQESLPYKALDGVIDDLSRILTRAELFGDGPPPEGTSALLRLFPVLLSVPALRATADLARPESDEGAVDPVLRRREGARALRDILHRISTRQRLFLWIDDLQWGDLDSVVLLRELMRPPDAPPMSLLFSYRSEEVGSSPVLVGLSVDPLEPSGTDRLDIAVGALSDDEARRLTQRILENLGVRQTEALDQIVLEAAGSPFFVSEIARHLASAGDASAAQSGHKLRLAAVLDQRIGSLDERDRRILEIAALAALPLSRELALEASGIGAQDWHRITRLERRALLRQRSGDEESTTIYHDRIGEAVIARLDAGAVQQRHGALCDALERRTSPDPEALVVHSLGAGRRHKAGNYAKMAADRAMDALAFDRAADLYRVALEHREGDSAKANLLVKRASALAGAGRGGDSGACYIDAANQRAQEEADAWEVQRLRGLGAAQLVRSGRLDEGLAVQREVLGQVGVSIPKSDRHALMLAAGRRLLLTGRGIGFSPRDDSQVSAQARRRLDALWSASTAMAMMNYAMADAFGTQHLIEALRVGERRRVAKALGYEAAFEAVFCIDFFTRRSQRMLAVAQQIADETQEPYDHAWVAMSRSSAMWCGGYFPEGRAAGERAYEIYSTQCQGVLWEMSVTQLYVLSSTAFCGDMIALVPRLDAALRDALERGDLFGANNYRLGQMSIARLAKDRVEEAMDLAQHAKATWPKTVYHTQHYHHAVLTVQAELYRGDPWKAFARINEAIPGLRDAQIHFNRIPWMEILHLQARAAVAAANTVLHRGADRGPTRPDPAWPAARLIHLAERTAREIERNKMPFANPFAKSLRAALAALGHRYEDADSELEKAVLGFERAGMELYREAARRRLGELRPGGAGDAARKESSAWFARQGVVRPAKMTAMLMPGIGSDAV